MKAAANARAWSRLDALAQQHPSLAGAAAALREGGPAAAEVEAAVATERQTLGITASW